MVSFGLVLAQVVVLVQDLALQVADVDRVEVDDADLPDARQRQVHRDRRPEPSSADDEHARLHDLALTGGAHLGHDDVPRVAVHLLCCEGADVLSWGRAVGGRILAGASRERGDDGHFVALVHLRLDALQRRDLLLVQVDVDVRGHLVAAAEDERTEAGELLVDVREDLAHVGALGLDVLAVSRHLAERRGNVDGDCGHIDTSALRNGKRQAGRRHRQVRQGVDRSGPSVEVQVSVIHGSFLQGINSQMSVLVAS